MTVPSASVTSSARQRPSRLVSSRRHALGSGQRRPRPRCRASCRTSILADDELLRDVDESTGQVAGVGGTERGVGEALARAVRRDEVLEHRQAFTEVALDRARDDLAARVGDEAAHTGDLPHLHDVSSGTRADHHVDRVELRRRQQVLHGPRHLVGGVGPDLDLLLAPLVVGDDAAVVLALDLGGLALELLEQPGLGAAAS